MAKDKSRKGLTIAVREVSGANAENYLRKAESHLATALEVQTLERWDTAVLLSVHAGISASDAACAAMAGVRSAGQSHMDQVKLIRQVFPGDHEADRAAGQLADLIDKKNTVEYEARRCDSHDANVAVKRAERLVNWARKVCHGS